MSGFQGFGQPSSSAGQSKPLFGTAGQQNTNQTPSSGLTFANASSAPSSGGLFGSSTQTTSASGGNIFANNAASNTAKPLFGSAAPTPSSGFGFNNASTSQQQSGSSATATPAPSSNIFGGSLGGSPAFGTPATSTTPSLFGKPSGGSATAAGSGNWSFNNAGKENASTTPASTSGGGNAFGASTTPASNPSSLFGPPKSQPQASTTPSAGTSQAKPSSIFSTGSGAGHTSSGPGLFQGLGAGGSSTTPQKPSPLSFSTTPAGNPPASNMFGGSSQPTQSNQQPTSSAPSSGNAFKPTSFTLGGSTANTGSSQSAKPLFGEVGSKAPATSTFTLPGSSSQTPAQTPAPATQQSTTGSVLGQGTTTTPAAVPTSSNLFGNLGQQQKSTPTTTASATTNMFAGLGAQPASTSSSQPAITTSTAPAAPSGFTGFKLPGQSSTAQPAASTTTTGPSLFAPTATSSAPSSQPAAAAAGTAGAASSTPSIGQAPPATSRLAQKSLHEILTMWSTSLGTHQKTFSQLAAQVSQWDRALVENSSAISRLYGRCFQAERDVSEVERVLRGVEQGQVELEQALERWERGVDELIEREGLEGDSGVGGVEGERERTYKSAENSTARLTDMSHSLSDMIDEINSASSKLSLDGTGAPKQEDPLAQIVRVLNSHLLQLQSIDSGAAALKERVEAAQRDARTLGGRNGAGQGINGQGWLDGFGKSYLGR